MLQECGGCAGAPVENAAYSSSVSSDRYVCVLSVIIHGKKKTLLGLLRPTLPMVCARAVKPEMRISESMLVADPSGRYIWLPEIPNLLPRQRMSVQCMYS